MLAHLRWIALKFAWKTDAWGSTITNSSRHTKIRPDTFITHDILLRDVAELTMMWCGKSWVRGKLLFQRSFTTAEATTLLSLSRRHLSWVWCVACPCVIQTRVVPLKTWFLRVWIRKLSPLLLLWSTSTSFHDWLLAIIMILLIIDFTLSSSRTRSNGSCHIWISNWLLLARLRSEFPRGASRFNLCQGWIIEFFSFLYHVHYVILYNVLLRSLGQIL